MTERQVSLFAPADLDRHKLTEMKARLRARTVEAPLALPVDYPMVWRVSCRLPERKGQRCRVVASGAKWTSLVEFEDGFRVFTSRRYLRRAAP